MESNTGAPIANLKASSSKRCRQIPSILLWLVTQSAVWQQSTVFYQNCFLTSVFTSNPAHLVFNTASGHWSVCLFCVAQVHTRVGLHYSLFLSRTFFFFFPGVKRDLLATSCSHPTFQTQSHNHLWSIFMPVQIKTFLRMKPNRTSRQRRTPFCVKGLVFHEKKKKEDLSHQWITRGHFVIACLSRLKRCESRAGCLEPA